LPLLEERIEYLSALVEENKLDSFTPYITSSLFKCSSSLSKCSPKDRPKLFTFNGSSSQGGSSVSNIPTVIMVDTGSNHDIISQAMVDRHKLCTKQAIDPMRVRLADGTRKSMLTQCEMEYNIGTFTETRTFYVLDIEGFDIILGMQWCMDLNPHLHFHLRQVKLNYVGKHHVLVTRDKVDVLHDEFRQSVNLVSNEELWSAESGVFAVHTMKSNEVALAPEMDGVDHLTLARDFVAVISPCQQSTPPTDEKVSIASFIEALKPVVTDKVELSQDSCNSLKASLTKSAEIFSEPSSLPPKRDVEHHIVEHANTTPPCFNSYRMSPDELKELKTQLDFLLERGYIRPSNSPYGAPVLFAPKKDGKLRLCLDFRGLNNQTVKDKYPLPRDQDIFDQLQGARYFTSLDALWGYWQIRVADEDVRKTAVRTPLGSYEFLVMPFGLTNAPATFQRFMEDVLRDHIAKYCMVYIDDIIIYSKTAEEHAAHIDAVLTSLLRKKVCIKLQKCAFFQTELEFLGHIISRRGILPVPAKLKAIAEWPTPRSVNEVQQFIGLGNYYRRHVQKFAEVAAPLTSLKEELPFTEQWNSECEVAFRKLKEYLTSSEVLALPDMTLPFFVRTDSSLKAVGGSLHQVQNGEERVIAYESRKLTQTAQNWPTHEREFFAYYHCFQTWRHYLQGSEVTLEGDHKPLTYLKTQPKLTAKQARWMSFLDSFNIKLKYIPGKELVGPDSLSRRPDLMESVQVPLINDVPSTTLHDFDTLLKCIYALQSETKLDPRDVSERFTDSTLLGDISITHDWIVELKRLALHHPMYPSLLGNRDTQSQYSLQDGLIYYNSKPKDISRRKLFVPDGSDLRHRIIHEYHDVPYAGHFGKHKTIERVQRHFYWPDMRETIESYIKSCDACQRFKYRTHKPHALHIPYDMPEYPWQVMAMDEKTGLPTSSAGNNAFWVFVDKLSRRCHIVPCKEKRPASEVALMFFDAVFRHHGVPQKIISDRDGRFTSKFWADLTSLLSTNLNMATTNRPQTDGQSERLIKTVSELVRNYANNNPLLWDKHVPALEFAYNDSVHPATGFTPFEIDMGRVPLTPISLLVHGFMSRSPLYRDSDAGIDPSEYLRTLANTIQAAKATLKLSQERQAVRLNKGVKPHEYRPGDKVYMEHPKTGTPSHVTMDARFLGPFKVVEKVGASSYKLELPYEMRFKHNVVNEHKLKPYHAREVLDGPDAREEPSEAVPKDEEAMTEPNPPAPALEVPSPSVTPELETHTVPEPPPSEDSEEPTNGPDVPSVPSEMPQQPAMSSRSRTANRQLSKSNIVAGLRVQVHPREKRVLVAEVCVDGLWFTLQVAIQKMKLWKEVHDYIQNSAHIAGQFYPLFQLMARSFTNTKYFAYVAMFDQNPKETRKYFLVHSDGDCEDITEEDFRKSLAQTEAVCNQIKTVYVNGESIDYSTWAFPSRLARLYARLTTAYDIDAMDHPSGRTSKAPWFCSKINSVFSHNLTGLTVWCNPDLDLIKDFVKHFLRCYERDVEHTSLMLVVPYWVDKPFWTLLRRFRVIDIFPAGSYLFTPPSTDVYFSNTSGLRSSTRWTTLVLYLGSKFRKHDLYKTLARAGVLVQERHRFEITIGREYCLSGENAVDKPVIDDMVAKIAQRCGPIDVFADGVPNWQ
jgi:hypothetical protein